MGDMADDLTEQGMDNLMRGGDGGNSLECLDNSIMQKEDVCRWCYYFKTCSTPPQTTSREGTDR